MKQLLTQIHILSLVLTISLFTTQSVGAQDSCAKLFASNTTSAVQTQSTTVDAIIKSINTIRGTHPNDKLEKMIQENLRLEVEKRVANSQMIRFVVPAFPFKATMTGKKVLGPEPDMAEEISMKRIARLVEEIDKVYPQKVEFLVLSDGYVFTDIANETDATATNYINNLKKTSPSKLIKFKTLSDFFEGLTLDQARSILDTKYSPKTEEIRAKIDAKDPDTFNTYLHFLAFFEETLKKPEGMSNRQFEKYVKEQVLRIMQRNIAFGNLIQEFHNDDIRFSIHPQSSNPKKVGIRLLSDTDYTGTPWHNTIVVMADGEIIVTKKHLAEQMDVELEYKNGRPYNYRETKPYSKVESQTLSTLNTLVENFTFFRSLNVNKEAAGQLAATLELTKIPKPSILRVFNEVKTVVENDLTAARLVSVMLKGQMTPLKAKELLDAVVIEAQRQGIVLSEPSAALLLMATIHSQAPMNKIVTLYEAILSEVSNEAIAARLSIGASMKGFDISTTMEQYKYLLSKGINPNVADKLASSSLIAGTDPSLFADLYQRFFIRILARTKFADAASSQLLGTAIILAIQKLK